MAGENPRKSSSCFSDVSPLDSPGFSFSAFSHFGDAVIELLKCKLFNLQKYVCMLQNYYIHMVK